MEAEAVLAALRNDETAVTRGASAPRNVAERACAAPALNVDRFRSNLSSSAHRIRVWTGDGNCGPAHDRQR
eukprot:354346-Chlamydomonas_euryale.AAC.9